MSPIVTPFSANNVVNRGNFNTKLEEVNVGAAEKVHDHDERYYSQSEVNVMLAEVMSLMGNKVSIREQIIYVSDVGSDATGDGTFAKPFRDIDRAFKFISSPVYPHHYTKIFLIHENGGEFNITITHNCNNKHIHIRNYLHGVGEKAVVNISGPVVNGILLSELNTIQLWYLTLKIQTAIQGAYSAVASCNRAIIYGCDITSVSPGSRFFVMNDGVSILNIALSNTSFVGDMRIITDAGNPGQLFLSVSGVSKDAAVKWFGEYAELTQLTKVGSWYTM